MYYKLQQEIKELVENGEWEPGGVIPSSRKIAETYNVSMGTEIVARRVRIEVPAGLASDLSQIKNVDHTVTVDISTDQPIPAEHRITHEARHPLLAHNIHHGNGT